MGLSIDHRNSWANYFLFGINERREEMFEFGVMACLCWSPCVSTNSGYSRGLLPAGSQRAGLCNPLPASYFITLV